ncbi:response regulator transcription factor [Erythrobacter aureus]|uniref:response regulator transcription factor n=1 Tax=Erythrobacter aureus TaxID=2182384 RepID=UPI003A937D1F
MSDDPILHIVGGSSRSRAEQARLGFELGYRCETYAHIAEFMERPPEDGIVLARDDPAEGGASKVLELLAEAGRWLPVIATAPRPRPLSVVEAVKAGVLDYIALPMKPERLAQSVKRISREADAYARARRRTLEARNRIASLSPREREVLDWLAEGCSSKAIARKLNISPRTVENHRANLMTKLETDRTAQAVKLQLEAHLVDEALMTNG